MIADQKGSNEERRTRRQVQSVLLMLLGLGLVVAAVFAAAPWLRTTLGAPTLGVVTAALCVLVLGASEYFALRYNRGLDEVQRASQGFAVRWGASAGQVAFILLLLLPPFQGFAASVVEQFAGDAGLNVDGRVVTLAMVFGLGSLVLLQTLGTFVFGIIWWKRSQQ